MARGIVSQPAEISTLELGFYTGVVFDGLVLSTGNRLVMTQVGGGGLDAMQSNHNQRCQGFLVTCGYQKSSDNPKSQE